MRIFFLLLSTHFLFAQSEKLEIEGAIIISDNDSPTPAPGTIKFDGTNFLGFNGTVWKSLSCCCCCCCDDLSTDCDGNVYDTIHINFCVDPRYLDSGVQSTLDAFLWTQDPNGVFANGSIRAIARQMKYNEANLRKNSSDATLSQYAIRCIKD